MRWEYKDCVPRGALFPASLWNHGPAVCSVTIFWRLGNRAAGRKGIGRSHGGTSCQSTCQKTVLQIIKRAVWAQGGLCEWTIDTIVTLIRQYYSSRISVQSGNSHQGFIYWYKQGCEDELNGNNHRSDTNSAWNLGKNPNLSISLHYTIYPITTLLLPATHNTTTLKQMSAYLSAALAVPHVLSCPSHELFYLQGRPLNIKLRKMTPEVTVPS